MQSLIYAINSDVIKLVSAVKINSDMNNHISCYSLGVIALCFTFDVELSLLVKHVPDNLNPYFSIPWPWWYVHPKLVCVVAIIDLLRSSAIDIIDVSLSLGHVSMDVYINHVNVLRPGQNDFISWNTFSRTFQSSVVSFLTIQLTVSYHWAMWYIQVMSIYHRVAYVQFQ